jgi:DNA mismatch repair protein MutS
LTVRAAIEERLALVAWLHDDPLLRTDLRAALRSLPDLGRALGRVVAGRGSPRDLGQLRDGLGEARRIRDHFALQGDRPALLEALLPDLGGHGALTDLFDRALVPSPPTERSQGGYIAEGYDAALDDLRRTSGSARRAIAALEGKYRAETGIAALKIRHNGVLGYFIEVPARAADALMAPDSGFTHRQTMAGAVRFNSLSLHEEASRIAEAGGHALAAEEAHFEELVGEAIAVREAIARTAAALARIDVAASHAERGAEGGWARPALSDEPVLQVEGGRHPVVEAALASRGERFVANDCTLAPNDRLWLIGGPNMGGKSTFLRQNALIVLLAQAGSFVPASSATVGLTNRLFSRVGASDNLARGRSTFMVEMVETAAILNQATKRSLVILDEIGRGTATFDGLSIAWAAIEHLHEKNRCRALFATHFHELTALADRLSRLSNATLKVTEWQGEVVFLHEVAPGAADRSYGLQVARLAGLPPAVVARAKTILAELERSDRERPKRALVDDLPLFSAAAKPTVEAAKGDEVRAALDAMNPDEMSPRDALEALYRLKAARAGER